LCWQFIYNQRNDSALSVNSTKAWVVFWFFKPLNNDHNKPARKNTKHLGQPQALPPFY